jgi:hypothetical protein
MNFLKNLLGAGAAVLASPVALVADVMTLPASAYDDKEPFARTGKMLAAAGACVNEAVKPEPKP